MTTMQDWGITPKQWSELDHVEQIHMIVHTREKNLRESMAQKVHEAVAKKYKDKKE